MEVEFVNAYIAKQKSYIEDLVAKNIILETRLQLAETKVSQLADELSRINTKVEKQNQRKKSESDF